MDMVLLAFALVSLWLNQLWTDRDVRVIQDRIEALERAIAGDDDESIESWGNCHFEPVPPDPPRLKPEAES